jgi:hypothetical protein
MCVHIYAKEMHNISVVKLGRPMQRCADNIKNNLHGIKKNGVFWDVMLCGSCKNGRFGGT